MSRSWFACGRLLALKARLQKVLADAGIASRRAAETLILQGKVSVNGEIVRTLGAKADPAEDRVLVDGRPLRARRRLYVAVNKPRDYLCTRRDERERRIVADLLPTEWTDLYPVGRLDRDSEGLVFMTNDGDFCLRLTHPRYGVVKHYQVTVEGKVDRSVIGRLQAGVEHDGELLRVRSGKIVSANATHSVLELDLGEGRNRELRRMFESLGFVVVRLVRTSIGPVRLGQLGAGHWRVLQPAEVQSLLRAAAPTP
ncbi:MAG: pseudouridine synthase [Limisphaerales bacterium]